MKCGVHQRLIVLYIYLKFHEIRFRGYLVLANCMGFNPLVPNHRKHCKKTFIFTPVTYFGRSNDKPCLKL